VKTGIILGLALLSGLAACAPSTVGGVRGYTSFAATARVETHHSKRPADTVAACFRQTATFLPKSRFDALPEGGQRYTLAGYGQWFEEISFRPDTAGGSTIEILTSANYAGNWVTMLARDRLEPLAACMAESH
jgi:hypothetical protein